MSIDEEIMFCVALEITESTEPISTLDRSKGRSCMLTDAEMNLLIINKGKEMPKKFESFVTYSQI